ncbi:adenosine kinase [Pseudomonadota bacterium]|jgi:sugar/nucleoside kinase (ribokinase family)|nr:adenosine kinase [Pseudomonadota bacterium]
MKNDISAIGNALVDTVFKVEHSLIAELGLEIDQMTLSSAEEHAPIIERLIASGADTVSDCGGSATNSLVAAASFGAKCFHTCKVSDDQDGLRYLESLKDAGVGHKGNMAPARNVPTGKCLILVTPDAKRTMTTALNVSSLMDDNDLDLNQIANSKIFYIEGYMVTSEENYRVTLQALNHLQNFPDVKIAFSLSDPGIVMGFKDKFYEMESFGLDYIFGNDDEAMAFVDAENIDEAFIKLQEKSYTSIITMGEKGSSVITSNEIIHTPKVNIEPVDTNGAGDMFAGSFLYALLQDSDLRSCAEFANYGASKVVETFGPRLTQEGYRQVLNNYKKS